MLYQHFVDISYLTNFLLVFSLSKKLDFENFDFVLAKYILKVKIVFDLCFTSER